VVGDAAQNDERGSSDDETAGCQNDDSDNDDEERPDCMLD